jgi:aminoglycoside phosphotransferase (APT) family kinase protein
MAAELAERATHAAQAWAQGAQVSGIRPLTGGASSLTFVAQVSGVPEDLTEVVLKVAPPGLPPVRNRDVLRQGRVMRALYGQPGVAVPPVRFEDPGEPPDVPPFVAMGMVPGVCVEPILADERDPAGEPEVRARYLDAVRVLAAMHSLEPAKLGLPDEPVSLTAEIDRWTQAYSTAPPDLQGEYERCASALHATVPASLRPVVNHGDYRLGNTLCQESRVTAVIDWEIWSVGDPRVDVTWLTFFTDEAHHPGAPTQTPAGTPTIEELLKAYADAGGPDLPHLPWFEALTRYKEAAATALLIKRGRKAGHLEPTIERMVSALPKLLEEAEHLLEGGTVTTRAI